MNVDYYIRYSILDMIYNNYMKAKHTKQIYFTKLKHTIEVYNSDNEYHFSI